MNTRLIDSPTSMHDVSMKPRALRLDWPMLSWFIFIGIIIGAGYLMYTDILLGYLFMIYALGAIVFIPNIWKPISFISKLSNVEQSNENVANTNFKLIKGFIKSEQDEELLSPITETACDYWSIQISWYGDRTKIGLKNGFGKKVKWHAIGSARSHAYLLTVDSIVSNYYLPVFLADVVGETSQKVLTPIEVENLNSRFPDLAQFNINDNISVTETFIPKNSVISIYGDVHKLPSNQLPNWVCTPRALNNKLDVFSRIFLRLVKYKPPVDLRTLVSAKSMWSALMHKIEQKKYGEALEGSKIVSVVLPEIDVAWGAIKTPVLSSIGSSNLQSRYKKVAWHYLFFFFLWNSLFAAIVISV